jgi:hypothetical protein
MRHVDVLTGAAVIAVLLPLFIAGMSAIAVVWPCIPVGATVAYTLYVFRK